VVDREPLIVLMPSDYRLTARDAGGDGRDHDLLAAVTGRTFDIQSSDPGVHSRELSAGR
jgi:hypothetical protein